MSGRGEIDEQATVTGLTNLSHLTPGTVLAQRFRLERLLGIGGMGMVWHAHDLALDVGVAVKLLLGSRAASEASVRRFRNELLLARQVSSPWVVRIHDLAAFESGWLISMELIDGESLDRLLGRVGALPVERAVAIATDLANGLAAAHRSGVVHRDLKPANVLVDGAGKARITDFGVARSLAEAGFTQTGVVVGTPDYLSPEQARGEPADARSDLYALGLILYEMLGGRRAYGQATPAERLAERMFRKPPPLAGQVPGLPGWLGSLVERLLDPEPANRPASAAEVAELLVLGAGHAAAATPARPRRRSLPLTVALALSVALAWWAWRAWPPAGDALVSVGDPPRLLVLPLAVQDDSGISGDVAVALTHRLRQAIASRAGRAVVDAERTAQALAMLGPVGAGADLAMLVRPMVRAGLSIAPTLRLQDPGAGRAAGAGEGDREASGPSWIAAAQLSTQEGAVGARIEVVANDPAGALDLLAQALVDAEAAPDPAPGPFRQADLAFWESWGKGLSARASGQPVLALDSLQEAWHASGDRPQLALDLVETAMLVGEQALAREVIESAMPGHLSGSRATVELEAWRHWLEGDPAAAAATWGRLHANHPGDHALALREVDALGAAGDIDKALAVLTGLLADDPDDARAWFMHGKFSILAGRARQGTDESLARALLLYARARHPFGQSEAVNALGVGFGRLGQVDEAERNYRRAIELRRAVGHRRGLAISLRNLAGLARLRGDFDVSAQLLAEARDIHEDLGDRNGSAAVDTDLGALAEDRGDYTRALAAYRRALAAREQAGNRRGVAESLNDIGYAHYQLGTYDSAFALWRQAEEIYAQAGDQAGRIRILQNLGPLALARGRWQEAEALLRQSLQEASEAQMIEESAVALRHLAELQWQTGRLESAIADLDRAQALFAERQDQRGLVDIQLLRLRILIDVGAGEDAQPMLDALAGELSTLARDQQAAVHLAAARASLLGSDRPAAMQALARARPIADATGVRLLQLQVRVLESQAEIETPTLAETIAELGHVPLELEWRLDRMRATLASGVPERTLEHYRETVPLLRDGTVGTGWEFHALAAHARRALGQDESADGLRRLAAQGRDRLRSAMPATLRPAFDRKASEIEEAH